ncbi:GGDEF domain-containing protein [Desulfovibrio mangrovi]|uniref:GGDEF domain-containing protein n=1 Tax=Desulfovibrio mangrovi TaxID=2976983 RepID=UPI00224514F9|nr:GGDEF domain-containing protein [Desulfovibrio mangrovi]UZP67066.1 GGDEF domain-containing protein [Desulfovibrio mangrovi]
MERGKRPTDLTLNEQLRITSVEIQRRKELMGITEEDEKLLHELRPAIARDVVEIVSEYYEFLVDFYEVAELIGDSETLERLKNHLQRYVLTLFSGQYDAEYVQTRLRIGLVHKRIGVPPKLYVAALYKLGDLLRNRLILYGNGTKACEACSGRMSVLDKILMFDLILVFDTYIQSLMDELHRHKDEVEKYAAGLEGVIAKRTEELAELSRKDGLTGLFNQRSFFEELRRELARSHRRNQLLSLCYIDLDGFKRANDTFGHKYGDGVLMNMASVFRKTLRAEDSAARYGGDEFCVILPSTPREEAVGICQRLASQFSEIDPQCEVTLSIGIAEFSPDAGWDADMLVGHADSAMYRSKRVKGHAITVWGEDADAGDDRNPDLPPD